ncbi:hypothetical protein ABEB36_001462 [Hypothenemus hampei]|uniref:Transposable element P transposase-like RNase H domain-containing protein n=1 Tax=Hypothenemus hampei TaxID=57062 RepID=A0ABD1FEM6_HYPHA
MWKKVASEIDNPQDLYITVIWDEISLKYGFTYCSSSDKMIGFEDWGCKRKRKFADHVIVFYIRLLASGNQMPIGCGFCNGTTNAVQLKWCIQNWIYLLNTAGFKPVVTICDQDGTNMSAINTLITENNTRRSKKHQNPWKNVGASTVSRMLSTQVVGEGAEGERDKASADNIR